MESAFIDGAGEGRIFFKIVAPLSKPALATVSLIVLLQYWNDWFTPLLLIRSKDLRPLQYMLQETLRNVRILMEMLREQTGVTVDIAGLPTESMRMAVAVLAAGPMLFVFPFFQKYFVKGLTVGSVKG